MRFDNIWLIIVSSVIAAATIIGAILFVVARNKSEIPTSQVLIPSLTDPVYEQKMPVEETITQVVFMLSPGNPNRLIPMERQVFNMIPQSRVAGQLLQELCNGPRKGEAALPPLPRGSRLENIYISERGMAVVFFNSKTRENHRGGTDGELMSIYSIVNTLCVNFPFIQSVQIVIEDSPDKTFAGHIDISYPLPIEPEYLGGYGSMVTPIGRIELNQDETGVEQPGDEPETNGPEADESNR